MYGLWRSCKASKGSPEEYYYNPLKCPLPKAPSMQFFCLYGIGLPTERSYYYLNLESDKVSKASLSMHAFCSFERRPSLQALRRHMALLGVFSRADGFTRQLRQEI